MGLSWTLAELVLFFKPARTPRQTNKLDSLASASDVSIASDMGDTKLSVGQLLDSLRTDFREKKLSHNQRTALLEQLKVYSRDKKSTETISARPALETVLQHGFDSEPSPTSRTALASVANTILLQAPARQVVVDLGYGAKAAERLKSDNKDDEFLVGRILFLLTYDTNQNFEELVNEHQLADTINQHLARHSKRFSKSSRRESQTSLNSVENQALAETLKLMFNITHFYPDLSERFSESIEYILKILYRIRLGRPVLQQPVSALINSLINLNLADPKCSFIGSNPLFPKFEPKCNAEHIINILDKAISEYKEGELDQLAAPVLTLIRKIYKIAPDNVRKYMEWLLLPSKEERNRPLGKSDTLAARLLRLSTSAVTPTLRSSISAMMFELSGENASLYVKNVGYGFAAGFLMSNNITVPTDAMEAYSTEGDAESERADSFNPVTGQRYDSESKDTGPEMTEEEKEREAERLFVLFERLKATGVVNVKNPVEQAVDEGRFEELD